MKTKIIIGSIFILLIGLWIFTAISKNDSGQKNFVAKNINEVKKVFSKYPTCPDNLEGILTAPLMEPKYIAALTPLGNINPPGHTSPVDHIYFTTAEKGKIPLLAPADAWISDITEISYRDTSGNYVPTEYAVSYTLCDGLNVIFAGYTELNSVITAELAKKNHDNCKRDIVKPGHDKVEGQCYFSMDYPVKSGDLIGYTQVDEQGRLPFEIWEYNHNKLARTDIDWAYYDKNGSYPYPRAFCLFDLYSGDLKKEFYSKFGSYQFSGKFTPRTIEPLCGTINQDVTGTIQGMWFGDVNKKNGNIEFEGKGLAFLHNNIDPTQAEISIGGNFMNSGIVMFPPKHSGTVDREFSEVKADGQIYCYHANNGEGIILVQLLDDRKLQVENQAGDCTSSEKFNTPFTYYR